MNTTTSINDPIEFMKGMWGNLGFSLPGMVTPTLDVDELDKRIQEFKAVEGWLKMNLSMLQMSIQGLEMQRTTIAAVQAMSAAASNPDNAGQQANPFNAALWPWTFMQGTAPGQTPPPAAADSEKTPDEPPRKAGKGARK